jgi:2-polyprenyl-3-methyl-5-hydroxy-6-metoxy-1,4-benzoquinol methylase
MFRYRLRQARDGIRRLLRVTTLDEHESLRDALGSVGSRLDAIARLVQSEADAGRRFHAEIERLTRDLESRLGDLESGLAAKVIDLESRLAAKIIDLESGLAAKVIDLESRLAAKVMGLSWPGAEEIAAGLKDFLATIRQAGVDRWSIREYQGLLRYLRRQDYLRAIQKGRLAVPRLETQHPLAVSSNDTLFPRGSKNDNSILGRFNRKLYQFLGDRPRLRVLDLGCAGGGFVRSLIDDGHFAVGLEGSDYPILNQAGEWATIPLHLFTCDVTKPFRLVDRDSGEPLLFDAVTAWEVMEHIPEGDLPGLFDNLRRHLAPGGYLLFSIATFLDWDERTGTIWHNTVKPSEWWRERFAQLGFRAEDEHTFGKDDWLRGSGQCRGDWHEDQGLGFHVVLKRTADSAASAEDARRWRASA